MGLAAGHSPVSIKPVRGAAFCLAAEREKLGFRMDENPDAGRTS